MTLNSPNIIADIRRECGTGAATVTTECLTSHLGILYSQVATYSLTSTTVACWPLRLRKAWNCDDIVREWWR